MQLVGWPRFMLISDLINVPANNKRNLICVAMFLQVGQQKLHVD